MKKYKFFNNFDNEEKWLNEMAMQGFVLVNKSVRYEFEPGKPDNTMIRIDYRTFKHQQDFEDYRALFEDSGWIHIAGSKSSGSQYFKKAEGSINEDIFSDVDSRAARYQRISQMWLSLAACFIPIFAVLISMDYIDVAAFLNPKSLYYTPGLWEKDGAQFWSSFLIETPFALFRGFIWMVIPVMIIIYMIFAIKAKRQYQKTQENKL